MSLSRVGKAVLALAVSLMLLAACAAPTSAPSAGDTAVLTPTALAPAPSPTPTPRADGLAPEEAATLSSLEQVDDYPLYIMYYQGAYAPLPDSLLPAPVPGTFVSAPALPIWACSLFAALGDDEGMVYGRNFDWEYSPAVLLFTDPPDGYASVSMVDLAYFFESAQVGNLTDLSLQARRPLLVTPFWPFDGMNEHGLVVGMAAVPDEPMPHDPDRPTVDSLMIIRLVLDGARDVDEALAIMEDHNLIWGGGPPVHYLVADASGRAILIEFYQGEMVVLPNEVPYHLATNHLRSRAEEIGEYNCWRYDRLLEELESTAGRLTSAQAMDLLADVAQQVTQWSVVYGLSRGDIRVSMGGDYDDVYTFSLEH